MTDTTVERYERCGKCGRVRHPYQFPYKNPDATLPDPVRRTIKPTPAASYEVRKRRADEAFRDRAKAVAAKRIKAQADGRDHSKCLPCQSAEGNTE